MTELVTAMVDIYKAVSMQISIWRWEIRMISRFGWNWDYKDPWERLCK
jgi:hypothetical protein